MLKGNRICCIAEALWGTQLAPQRSARARARAHTHTHTHTRAFSINYGEFEQLNNCQHAKYECTLAYTLVCLSMSHQILQ